MIFLLSPAKTLDFVTPCDMSMATQPRMLEQSAALVRCLRAYTPDQLSALMTISPELAELNVARFRDWQPPFHPGNAKPAVLAFMGDVYGGLAASELSASAWTYLAAKGRILSGLYGLLRPFDLIQPYRLEMGTRLPNAAGKDLYAFWGETITALLDQDLQAAQEDVVINLASDEYFKAIRPAKLQARLIHCRFEDEKHGQYKIISFFAKRARGLMARFAAERDLTHPEALKSFDQEGYAFCPDISTPDRWIFRRAAAQVPSGRPSA